MRSTEPVETVTLIPMGAARLRIPRSRSVGRWRRSGFRRYAGAPPRTVTTATVEAADDGVSRESSADTSIPRFTWWDRRGTTEWLEYDLR